MGPGLGHTVPIRPPGPGGPSTSYVLLQAQGMECEGASAACTKVIRDCYSGKENGVSLAAEACLKLNNFRTFRGWFGEEITRESTKRSEPSQFWSVAHQHGEAKALGPL